MSSINQTLANEYANIAGGAAKLSAQARPSPSNINMRLLKKPQPKPMHRLKIRLPMLQPLPKKRLQPLQPQPKKPLPGKSQPRRICTWCRRQNQIGHCQRSRKNRRRSRLARLQAPLTRSLQVQYHCDNHIDYIWYPHRYYWRCDTRYGK